MVDSLEHTARHLDHQERLMPKPRPSFDMSRYQELKSLGLPQRQIAKAMGIPEATLRTNLKVLRQHQEQGTPIGDQGGPPSTETERPEGDLRVQQDDQGPPPLYVHPGIPDDTAEESVRGAEDIEGLHQSIPVLPLAGLQQDAQGTPQVSLSPHLVEALTEAWPDLQALITWWQERQRQVHQAGDPDRELTRQTYHVQRRFIDLIKREADLDGTTYAAVVNRAFAQYFGER